MTRAGTGEFELSVLGPGFGESIVLHLPGVGWGVVDGCRDTLPYLLRRNVDELQFVALTHPDSDHYLGLTEVLKHYVGRIRHAWLYCAVGAREMAALSAHSIQHGRGPFHRYAAFLEALFNAVDAGAQLDYLAGGRRMLSSEGHQPGESPLVTIQALAPSAMDSQQYAQNMAKQLPKEGEVYKPPRQKMHNMVSAALRITWRNWSAVLGGDVEAGRHPQMGWRGVVSHSDIEDLTADIVKVSHHGSITGHLGQAWQAHLKDGRRKVDHAVLAPNCRLEKPLPASEDLDRVSASAKEVRVSSASYLSEPERHYRRKTVWKLSGVLGDWQVIKEDWGQVVFRVSVDDESPTVELIGAAKRVR